MGKVKNTCLHLKTPDNNIRYDINVPNYYRGISTYIE